MRSIKQRIERLEHVQQAEICPCCGRPLKQAADAIETYYRRRAAGSKVTLQEMADRFGYSLAYLKTAKRRYDAAGKWGSKKANGQS